jgi:DeoR/GlpR family transcriptional regulator of sugar metabolism
VLTQQRKRLLLDVLRRDRRIVAKDAARDLDVSEDTIRRDLRELARDGLLQRVHGGALPSSQAVQDLGARQAISVPEKAAIGRAAAAMVRRGQVVFIDGGTTAVQLARSLDPELKVTVVTHSPIIAVELAGHAVEVQMIGGRLFRHSMVNVGAAAVDAIRRIRADAYFMGVTGIHPEIGLTTGDAEEAAIKRALMEASAEVVVLGSPEKLGAASPFVIAPADAMTTLVVSAAVPAAELAPYEALEIGILRA